MVTERDEAVAVAAVFCRGSVRPVWFDRRGRKVRIREVAFAWKTREGNTPILHFSVSDGQGLFELRYNTGSCAWRLHAGS